MIPSSEAVAQNIRKTIDELAAEIADRVANGTKDDPHSVLTLPVDALSLQETVEHHARIVLINWFLGAS
jgi:hypothetical protein